MFGLIAKLTIAPGRRQQVIGLLSASTQNMPGCESYVIARDTADENVLWVTEVWESQAAHDASLSLRAVQAVMPQVRPFIVDFVKLPRPSQWRESAASNGLHQLSEGGDAVLSRGVNRKQRVSVRGVQDLTQAGLHATEAQRTTFLMQLVIGMHEHAEACAVQEVHIRNVEDQVHDSL